MYYYKEVHDPVRNKNRCFNTHQRCCSGTRLKLSRRKTTDRSEPLQDKSKDRQSGLVFSRLQPVGVVITHLSRSWSLWAPVWWWPGWRRSEAWPASAHTVPAPGIVDPPAPVCSRGGCGEPAAPRGVAGTAGGRRGSRGGTVCWLISPEGGKTSRAPTSAAETWAVGGVWGLLEEFF